MNDAASILNQRLIDHPRLPQLPTSPTAKKTTYTGHCASKIDWQDFATGNHRIACPACSRKANDKTMGLTVGIDGRGVGHCFRCSYVETHHPKHASFQRPGKAIKAPTAAAKNETLSAYGQRLWAATKPLNGVAMAYLESRHCAVPEYGDLRYIEALKHPISDHIGPCLVALITDVFDAQKKLSLHRTWITPTGKADVSPSRMLLGNHSVVNGVIRLTPDDEVGHLLGIAEGAETALSIALAPMHTWATIDAGHLSKFPVLNGVQTLFIAQDRDAAGIAAATTCAARWASAGKTVYLTQQKQNDLNDVVMGGEE